MFKISIIIVNYNVERFLEQCLYSVQRAISGISAEIFVIDNDSADNSCEMVRQKFPAVTLIANNENLGFSKANNQAIKRAKGEYILLLNPDTIIEEDTLSKTLAFMDVHPDAGGLGVKMIDGNGLFLPESKRGLPTPSVAFYKVSGLSKLFPLSKRFGRYHLRYLDPDKIHTVDVLSGAFMLLRRTVVDEIGLLDEEYFMYGEDIDMSYRITQAGFSNYYYPKTTIVHFKGESTKKGTLNYVMLFYKAMYIFAHKHYRHNYTSIFCSIIKIAIILRATVSIMKRMFSWIWLPIFDLCSIYYATCFFSKYYAFHCKGQDFHYPDSLYYVALPMYAIMWVAVLFAGGCYRKIFNPAKFIKTILAGSAAFFIIYALLPESIRFSRAIMLFGSLFVASILSLLRFGCSFLPFSGLSFKSPKGKKILLVGTASEMPRLKNLLLNYYRTETYETIEHPYLASDNSSFIKCLQRTITIFSPCEIIFSSQSIPSALIIRCMMSNPSSEHEYKVIPPEAFEVLSTRVFPEQGSLLTLNSSPISSRMNKFKKRIFDCVLSVLLLLIFPLSYWLSGFKSIYFQSCFLVLIGSKTWVSLSPVLLPEGINLPRLKQGVFSLTDINTESNDNSNIVRYINNYSPRIDLQIMLRNWTKNLSDNSQ